MRYKLLYSTLFLMVLLTACQKYELLPPASEDPFHPSSGIELISVDSVNVYTVNFQRKIDFTFTTHLELFPNLDDVNRIVVFRDGELRNVVNIYLTEWTEQYVTIGQTYIYEFGYRMNSNDITKLSEPITITVE